VGVLFFKFLAHTGLRIGEAVALDWARSTSASSA
jgi:integrase